MDENLVLDFEPPNKVIFLKGEKTISKHWDDLISFWAQGATIGSSIETYFVPLEDYLLKRKWFKVKWINEGRSVHVTEALRTAVNLSQEIKNEFEKALNHATNLDFDIELDGFRRTLTDEQYKNVKRSLALKNGANFSVPGAGKTTTTLAVWNHLYCKGVIDNLLVICPKSAFEAWSGDELEEIFEKPPCTQELDNKRIRRETRILISNYEKLENETFLEKLILWMQNGSVMMVLDEAHRIKGGSQSVRWRACKKVAGFAKRVELLTGTPMPQGFDDLRNLFNLSWGCLPQKYLTDQKIAEITPNSVFVRTTKEELKLPPVEIKEIPIEPSDLQLEIYSALKDCYKGFLNIGSRDKSKLRKMGKAVMSLIAAASNPGLIFGKQNEDAFMNLQWPPVEVLSNSQLMEVIDNYASHEMPPKYSWLARFVHQSHEKGQKTLVWSNFVGNLRSLEKLLSKYHPAVICGAVSQEDRKRELFRFREDSNCSVLLTNPQTLGEGISLHRVCNQAVYVDRTYNAGHYLQSLDRIHRLGLSQQITTKIYILTTNHTIDYRINVRLSEKVNRMAKMLCDDSLVVSSGVIYDEYESFIDLGFIEEDDADDLFGHLK